MASQLCFAPIAQSNQLRATSIGDLIVTECRADAGVRLPWHAHQHANVVLLLTGSFTETFQTRTVSCLTPVALYKPAGVRHANEYGRAGARFLVLELVESQIEQLRSYGAVVDGIRRVQESAVVDLTARLYRELLQLDSYSTLSVAGLIYELLAVISRGRDTEATEAPPRWLQRVRDDVHDNFSRRLNITDLAAEVNVHPDHLSRCFRRHYGMLIGDYVRRLRIEWASKELINTDRPIAELAIASGFVDQSEFTRRFRERFGVTPGRYRAALQR
jgi:AraC family transcriptional regulator